MHYYQFNISDYRKDTGHLSLLEHAIYRSLIDTYMLEESPLCADNAKLMRTHSVRTKEEVAAFFSVLSDFFVLRETGYHLARCDSELERIYEKSEKARVSAMKRWEKKDANAMRTHSEGNANGMLPITYNLIPKEKKPSAIDESIVLLIDRILDLYMEIIKPRCHVNGFFKESFKKDKKRMTQLVARIKEKENHSDIEFWTDYFKKCTTVEWIRDGINGNPTCTIDMLFNKTKFYKFIDRFYAS